MTEKKREKQDIEADIASKVQAEKDRLIPLIEQCKQQKEMTRNNLAKDEELQERELQRIAEQKKKIEDLLA